MRGQKTQHRGGTGARIDGILPAAHREGRLQLLLLLPLTRERLLKKWMGARFCFDCFWFDSCVHSAES